MPRLKDYAAYSACNIIVHNVHMVRLCVHSDIVKIINSIEMILKSHIVTLFGEISSTFDYRDDVTKVI